MNDVIGVQTKELGRIAVYNIDGQFFATDDICTHGEAHLSDGEVDGLEILCPFHRGSFNIMTGEAIKLPCRKALKTYTIVIIKGDIFIAATR